MTPGAKGNAGIPDFLTFRSPDEKDNAVVWEVKTYWAYKDREIESIFEAGHTGVGGKFPYDKGREADTVPQKIIKQVHIYLLWKYFPVSERRF
jgi:hypothetical protein